MNEDIEIDGLTVSIGFTGSAATNVNKFIRSKYDKPTGAVHSELSNHFKCITTRVLESRKYVLTFQNENDMMFFILHT